MAERDGAIVGAVAHVGPGRPRADFFPGEWSVIRMLVVDPARRGQGAGRALVAGCLRLAREAGAPFVGLHTSPVMASALRMYEAIGFVRDRDLPPIRGVPYGRYVLAAAGISLGNRAAGASDAPARRRAGRARYTAARTICVLTTMPDSPTTPLPKLIAFPARSPSRGC